MGEESSENQVQNQVLTEEEKKDLIKRAIEEGREEARYILTAKKWSSPHSDGDLKVLTGEVESVLLDKRVDQLEKEWTYAIMPRTRMVILLHLEKDDFDGPEEHVTLYAFTKDGWKSVSLY